jgi:hypothetical protein
VFIGEWAHDDGARCKPCNCLGNCETGRSNHLWWIGCHIEDFDFPSTIEGTKLCKKLRNLIELGDIESAREILRDPGFLELPEDADDGYDIYMLLDYAQELVKTKGVEFQDFVDEIEGAIELIELHK